MRTAFADAAIGNHFVAAVNSLPAIELPQFIVRLERAVFTRSLRPRNICRAGNVPSALSGFRKSRRRENLAGELVHGAYIDKLAFRFLVHHREYRVPLRAD